MQLKNDNFEEYRKWAQECLNEIIFDIFYVIAVYAAFCIIAFI